MKPDRVAPLVTDPPQGKLHPYAVSSIHCGKGLERQCIIRSTVPRFNHARTITKASATSLDAREDDYNNGICSPGSLINNPVKKDSHDASFP